MFGLPIKSKRLWTLIILRKLIKKDKRIDIQNVQHK